jgi:hypothetical protein
MQSEICRGDLATVWNGRAGLGGERAGRGDRSVTVGSGRGGLGGGRPGQPREQPGDGQCTSQDRRDPAGREVPRGSPGSGRAGSSVMLTMGLRASARTSSEHVDPPGGTIGQRKPHGKRHPSPARIGCITSGRETAIFARLRGPPRSPANRPSERPPARRHVLYWRANVETGPRDVRMINRICRNRIQQIQRTPLPEEPPGFRAAAVARLERRLAARGLRVGRIPARSLPGPAMRAE